MYTATIPLETDGQILEALRSGDRDRAATAFVRTHQQFVYAVALRHLRNHEDARDAAQETFLKALKALDRFEQHASFRTWLYKITVNTCISMQRKRRFMSFFAVGEGEDERDVPARQLHPDEQAVQSEFEIFLNDVIETLPPKQRETFCLRYFDELSYEEISAMVGTSIGALKANYHWATKKIADRLRESEYYQEWFDDDTQA